MIGVMMCYTSNLNYLIKTMVISAGILFVYEDKVLLTHPTKGRKDMWGIPKGKLETNEDIAEAASREVMEEVGININVKELKNRDFKEIIYKDRKNKVYKKIYYYIYKIKKLSDINLSSETIPKSQLSLREINKASFFDKDEAYKIIFWRQKDVLEVFENNSEQVKEYQGLEEITEVIKPK